MRIASRRTRLVSLLFACFVLPATTTVAMERPSPEEIRRYKADGSFEERVERAREIGNHRVKPGLAAKATYRLQMEQWRQGLIKERPTPPPAWQGMPTTGTAKIFALLIAFSDYPFSNTQASIDAKLYGDGSGGAPYESVRNFYRRASYNQLELTGATLGWYTTAYPRSDVPMTTTGRQNLIKEALNSFEAAGHDFSQYDNDGDGDIDYFVVIWTGPAGAWASFWWGYQTSFGDGTYLLDGKRLRDYSWQWETNPVGGTFTPRVVIHETGHALGLPDYYDYDDTVGPNGGVGGLDQMDANWGDHNCFSKFLLDWITPTVISGGTNLATLNSSGTSENAVLFAKGATSEPFAEYFMVQNRNKDGNDTTHPGTGLLIWHVDAQLNAGLTDYLYDNSYTEHKLLRLMEADSLEEIEAGGNADAGDYYVSGRTLSPGSLPSIARYDGVSNPMRVWTISTAGDPMTAHIDEFTDATPPTGVPGAPTDEGATTASTDLTFTWTQGTAADPETGIAGYDLQVGTTVGGSDLFDGAVGNVLSRTVGNAQDSLTYYARVRAVNDAGLKSSWSASSDGITVNLQILSCTALDNCALVFKTGGAAPWFEQSTVSYYGGSSAQSGAIGNNQSSLMQTTVVGPGTFSFWWRVSSEAGWDFLTAYVDGVVSGSGISGEVDWTQQGISIAAGTHVVKWVYSKDPVCCVSGGDAGWVDRVEWTGSVLSIDDVSLTEGNSGTQTAAFTVTLAPPSALTVTVSYTVANGTATSTDNDFTGTSGTLTFAPGITTQPVNVMIRGDAKYEPNETYYVNLYWPQNAAIADGQGLGTIANDDSQPTVSVGDTSFSEGNSGSVTYYFPVSLSNPSSQTVTVNYATADGTATTADGDYTAASGTITFNPGVIARIAGVAINGDTRDEPDETLLMNLSGPSNATIADNQGVGTITNDDAVPSLSINDVTVTEGNAGGTPAVLTVTLSAVSDQTVTVSYATANGTATTADSDYASASGTLTFNPGTTTRPVDVMVNGDTKDEANETFYVNLSTPSNATIADSQGVGTITNDDAVPSLSIDDVTVTEGNSGVTPATFTVALSAVSGQTVTVAYAATDDTASSASGDYNAISGTLTFAPGVTMRPLSVTVNGDVVDEPNELFRLTLSSPTNASLSRSQGIGEIVDDDGVGGPTSAAPLELNHGSEALRSLAALPGPVQEQHFFLIQQKAYSSYEVVVDGISGDLGFLPGSPLAVALIAADGTTVLRQAAGASALGRVRSLRWVRSGAVAVTDQRIRVRSGSCTTTCGAEDRYRLRAYETTYAVPRFNNAGTQTTVLVVQNPTSELVTGTVYFWDSSGTLLASQAFSLAAKSALVLNTGSIAGAAGKSGALTIANDAPYGALSGKTVALEAATGFSFDSPMVPRAVR